MYSPTLSYSIILIKHELSMCINIYFLPITYHISPVILLPCCNNVFQQKQRNEHQQSGGLVAHTNLLLQTYLQCLIRSYFSLNFIKYSSRLKMFEMEVSDINEMCILS
jgi:hypothetical protein